MKKNNIKSLCISSILAALYVAFELIAMYSGLLAFGDNFQIPISCFPLILASVLLGPFWGTSVGIVGSFLSQMLSPYGISWSSFIWMIPTIMYSLIISLLFIAFKKSYKTPILALEFVISSLTLSTLNIAAYYSYNFFAKFSNIFLGIFVPIKLIFAIVFSIIFALIAPPIIKKMKKFIN